MSFKESKLMGLAGGGLSAITSTLSGEPASQLGSRRTSASLCRKDYHQDGSDDDANSHCPKKGPGGDNKEETAPPEHWRLVHASVRVADPDCSSSKPGKSSRVGEDLQEEGAAEPKVA